MLTGLSEAFSEPCKTPKMELSGKNIKVVLGMSAGLMEYSKTCETPKMEFLCKNIKIVLAMSGGLKDGFRIKCYSSSRVISCPNLKNRARWDKETGSSFKFRRFSFDDAISTC